MINNEDRSKKELNKILDADERDKDMAVSTDNDVPFDGNLNKDSDNDSSDTVSVNECGDEKISESVADVVEGDGDGKQEPSIADDFVDDKAFEEYINDAESISKKKDKCVSWKERSVKERIVTLVPTVFIFSVFVLAVCELKIGSAYAIEFSLSFLLLAASAVVGTCSIRLGRVWGWIVTSLAPAAAFFLTEFFTHNPFAMSIRFIFVNLLIYYLIAAFVLFLTGSMKASVAVSTAIPMLFGLINYFVLEFRGTPFFPWDIASAGIAADVVGNYEFVVTWHLCFIVSAFIFIIQLGFLCTPRIRLTLWWLRAPVALISAVSLVIMGSLIQSDWAIKTLRIYPHLFSPHKVYTDNGAAVAFLYTLQFAEIDKPDGYDLEVLEDMLSQYENEEVTDDTVLPNVIVIMNEAFSDLKTIVDYESNMPVTPYIDSLSEDTVKGTLHVSVKGGNTANSEFEFLTGISMANMTPGCIPYQQHIKGETPTFVKQLGELGYKTVGMHPYGATGWKRNQVYEWFGFDEMYFVDYFHDSFDDSAKIRDFYSDASTYEKVIEMYESKKEGQPLFVFDVTMQNHGGYSPDYDNFTPEQFINGLKAENGINKYLTLINESDRAFGELVEYFKAQDEPTVILMYGDHQPHDSYVKPLLDRYGITIESGSLDEQLRRYTVPYVMWANYDIEEENDVDTSINYLSSMLCEKAGIPRTSVQMYLSDLATQYPVITEGHFSDATGTYKSAADMNSIRAFTEYEMISYNMIVDRKNTLSTIYSYN